MLSAHRFCFARKNQIALAFFRPFPALVPGRMRRRCLDMSSKTAGVTWTPAEKPPASKRRRWFCRIAVFRRRLTPERCMGVQKQKGFGIFASANVLRSIRYIAFAWILSCQRKRRSTFRSDHHSP